jgi:hypothetical protein
MKRRDFLKKSALVLGSLAVAKEGLAQDIHKGHEIPSVPHDMKMHMPVGWADPNIQLSLPPLLMGKQMGRVITPNVPPLGYEMDKNVKVFTLIAHPIHLHGYTWNVVGTEGGPIPESAQWPGNTVNVPPGTVRDVEFIAWNPGYWHFHCHKLHHTVNAHADMPMGIMPMGGMTTFLNVIAKQKGAKWRHPKEGRL